MRLLGGWFDNSHLPADATTAKLTVAQLIDASSSFALFACLNALCTKWVPAP
jgi:hypothetical protein